MVVRWWLNVESWPGTFLPAVLGPLQGLGWPSLAFLTAWPLVLLIDLELRAPRVKPQENLEDTALVSSNLASETTRFVRSPPNLKGKRQGSHHLIRSDKVYKNTQDGTVFENTKGDEAMKSLKYGIGTSLVVQRAKSLPANARDVGLDSWLRN